MQQRQPTPPAAGISLSDIYYVLFRRKWLILFFAILGFSAAGVIYVKTPIPYVSSAQLMVRYVQDSSKTVAVGPNADTVRQADARGDGIIASEAAMLSSYDVAKEVAETLGAKKILGPGVVETNVATVAATVQQNLFVDVPKRGNVISVFYKSPEPTAVQPVLQEIIKAYYKKHLAVHRDTGEDSFFTERMTTLRGQLSTAEEELRKAKGKANIISLDETKRYFSEQRSKLNDEISKASTELAEKQATLQEWIKIYPNALNKSAPASNATNEVVTAVAEAKPSPRPPADKIDEYKRLLERLSTYRKKDSDLRQIYTSEAVLVKENMASITEHEGQKKKLEEEFPGLLEQEQRIIARNPERSIVDHGAEFVAAEAVRVKALTARIKELNAQQANLNKQIEEVDGLEASIGDWQRKKEEAETRIKVYSAGLEQDLVNQSLANGNMSNIKAIQEPTPATRDTSKVYKAMGGAAGGGLGLGLALAFLLELILNQTVRRASEIPGKFRLPVFINIPEFRKFGRGRSLKALTNGAPIVEADGDGSSLPSANGNGHTANGSLAVARRMPELPPWDEKHDLYPFSEALRDRLVTFFEVKGMTHKPKLIAMTSCNHGAGVTTVAAGLAASLSETGEGNVLLVDMNMDQGAAHPFYRGKPACGLEELLMSENKAEKREEAMVQDKLFVVSGADGDARLPKILPKRFTHLLPKLQSSDYDYIIFDMPPMSQTSVTPRLAALMDVVLMVVESGKTHRDVLQHANAMLQETKTNVGVVFNRQRNYVPRALHQEL